MAFYAKKKVLQKIVVVWAKNADIFSHFFRKYFKNDNIGPCETIFCHFEQHFGRFSETFLVTLIGTIIA
jgi:ABC-type phosphate/phosphonate transport system permease subunit